VLEQERVLAASPAARAAGVQPGMRRGGVLMLLPEAQVHERSPPREAEALHAVAMALLQYTPQVAEAEEATLLMDVGASLRLFGGVRALCRRMRANLRALGFTASLSCAPTARGAWLLARQRAGRAHGQDGLAGAPPRPLDRAAGAAGASLAPGSKASAASRWATCGACRGPACSGAAAGAARPARRRLRHERPSCSNGSPRPKPSARKLELFDRIEHAELLLAGARRLLLQLTGWLCARQLAVERIVLSSSTSAAGWRARRPASRSRWPSRPGATNTWCAC
jgi:protein ImuB